MRYFIADALMWILKPVLGPMLSDINQNITSLIQRKVERHDVMVKEDGILCARDPSAFKN